MGGEFRERGAKRFLIVTVDVEEDNWGDYAAASPTFENVGRIPRLQEIFDRHHVRPTYLVTYPVVSDPASVRILGSIFERGGCEIATHVHPWNTPPFEEQRNAANSMLCNLPPDLQVRKIESLHEKIRKNFGMEPVSFRAGRWGYDRGVASNIRRSGYSVDSSITPYVDWRRCHGPDHSRFSPKIFRDPAGPQADAPDILEVPATIGFRQANFDLCGKIDRLVSSRGMRRSGVPGLLGRSRILNKIWLSPEMADDRSMIRLTETMITGGYEVFNMFFHSLTAVPRLTPFTRTASEGEEFLERIDRYLEYAGQVLMRSATLSECPAIAPRGGGRCGAFPPGGHPGPVRSGNVP